MQFEYLSLSLSLLLIWNGFCTAILLFFIDIVLKKEFQHKKTLLKHQKII